MLKSLELVGFKSFADKTQFVFTQGVTVIVGPNGSGKSNIVDAIKWALGAQSVKSLRGQEMADVIFNGSGSRRPLNTAETTVTFDNSSGNLAIDTAEVAITRRVYRSGEGEYMINRQPCRLRDIRDLFAGTGIATEAYSVIEQGKVDVMLQSSPRERRAIFEEAAGISRFKAKKLEASRRLDRVEQNLLRLSDIVDEVAGRLRTVKMQATKAQRYQEHTDRLQELRTYVGRMDWRLFSQQIDALQDELREVETQRDQDLARAESREAQALQFETEIAQADQEIRSDESQLAKNREEIAAHEATIEHQRARIRDVEEQISRHRGQLSSMSTRAGDVGQQLSDASAALDEAQVHHRAVVERVQENRRGLGELNKQFESLREQLDKQRSQHMERLRSAASISNRISEVNSQIASSEQTVQRCVAQLEQLASDQKKASTELSQFSGQRDDLANNSQSLGNELQSRQAQLTQNRARLTQIQKRLAELQGLHSGAAQRTRVLEELEQRLEGLNAGVRQALLKSKEATDGPWRYVRGLVADLFRVNVETAPVIEVVLGERAQYLVVTAGQALLEHLEQVSAQLPGRVGFLRLDVQPPASAVDRISLIGEPGVLGRLDKFVETSPEFVPLLRRLLGRTWMVDTLARAITLAQTAGRGLNLVTANGELLTAEGTIVLGPPHSATGLISRRSELRALREQIFEFESTIEQLQVELHELEEQIQEQDRDVQSRRDEHVQVTDALREARLRVVAIEDRLEQLGKQYDQLTKEKDAASHFVHSTCGELQKAQSQLHQTETELADFEKQTRVSSSQLEHLDQDRAQTQLDVTEGQVELAKSEQQLDHLRKETAQLQRDQSERNQALDDIHKQSEECRLRAQEYERRTLNSAAQVAQLYIEKETLAQQCVRRREQREVLWEQRSVLASEAQACRQALRSLEKRVHEKQLRAGQLEQERRLLGERLSDDYGIPIHDLESPPDDSESQEQVRQREEVEHEIRDLRKKINNIGNVNLEALEELNDLESRYKVLAEQHEDLSNAKSSLEQIIHRINADSRKLFKTTIDTVREHFQDLFRKLFGGGHADLVLDADENVDVLESGIDIVARPPGTEPRSISLLSGGEKTLTCVALLLAIFRSRPSPFCVLDEVDAALDEANIERFTNVLSDFLNWTQFIVVTHSKKTMTAADTLYGVTMQETGVSKRVSVQFEDVSEDGEIRDSAVGNDGHQPPAEKEADGEPQAA